MRPEDRLQVKCAKWLQSYLPEPNMCWAVEHGRLHRGDAIQRAQEWQRLKKKGVKVGVPDLHVALRGRYLAIELKVGKNTETTEQQAFGANLRTLGHGYHVARSVSDLAAILAHVGVALPASAIPQAAAYDRELAMAQEPAKAKEPRKPRPTSKRPALDGLAAIERARKRGFVG